MRTSCPGTSSSRLTAIGDAISGLVTGCGTQRTHRVKLADALGRVLAEPIVVDRALPSRAIALRAGWAVAASEVVGASAYGPVFLARAPLWVELGGELPAHANAILPHDAVSHEAGLVAVLASVAPGENVRRAGEDVAPGAVLREAGERIRPTDTAVLRAAGIESCAIRKAAVSIFASPEGMPLAELLAEQARAAAALVFQHSLPSEPGGILQALREAEGFVIWLAPDEAWRSAALQVLDRGGTLLAEALALRPGEGSGCGLWENLPVLITLARHDIALAVMLAVVIPCLDRLLEAKPWRGEIAGRLTRKIASGVGVSELALLRRKGDELESLSVGDLTLAALARADAWLLVAPESEGYPAGAWVRAAAI